MAEWKTPKEQAAREKAYLKGRLFFTGGTYNAGRNAMKRLKRANAKSKTPNPLIDQLIEQGM